MRQQTEQEVLKRLTALCARGEHCAYEMREKMRRWDVDEEVQQRVVSYLEQHHFIDEERYCRAFVNDKLTYNKWGRRKVEQALYAKRIGRETINRVLEEVEPANYEETLRHLIEAKSRSVKAETDYERRTKLIRFALSRGFTMDVVLKVLGDD